MLTTHQLVELRDLLMDLKNDAELSSSSVQQARALLLGAVQKRIEATMRQWGRGRT